MIEKKVSKQDIEGFLSAFSYNTYGSTNITSIGKLIFTRDDLIPEKLVERKWANPPPVDVNKDFQMEGIEHKDMHNKRIKEIICEIEDKVFVEKTRIYALFKRFDMDGDGYVSHQDFDDFIKSIKVKATKKEVSSIIKLLEGQNQGYLTFTDFSKVFNPRMSSELVQLNQTDTHMQNMAPSEERYRYNHKNQGGYNTRVKEIRETFKPDPDQSKSIQNALFYLEIVPSTRFSSKPAFANTFVNF